MSVRLTVDSEVLASHLRALRGLRGWSQQELERRSGVTQESISKLERGLVKRPSEEMLKGIAKAYDMDLDGLMKPPVPADDPSRAHLANVAAAWASASDEPRVPAELMAALKLIDAAEETEGYSDVLVQNLIDAVLATPIVRLVLQARDAEAPWRRAHALMLAIAVIRRYSPDRPASLRNIKVGGHEKG